MSVKPRVSDVETIVVSLSRSLVELTAALFALNDHNNDVQNCIEKCLHHLYGLCALLQVELHVLVSSKIKLYQLKDNAEVCKKRNKTNIKYNEDIDDTTTFKTQQNEDDVERAEETTQEAIRFNFYRTFADLMSEVTVFAKARCSLNKYSRKSLAFYLLKHLGEFAEVLNGLPLAKQLHSLPGCAIDALNSEIADIAISLLHACREHGVHFEPCKTPLKTSAQSSETCP